MHECMQEIVGSGLELAFLFNAMNVFIAIISITPSVGLCLNIFFVFLSLYFPFLMGHLSQDYVVVGSWVNIDAVVKPTWASLVD